MSQIPDITKLAIIIIIYIIVDCAEEKPSVYLYRSTVYVDLKSEYLQLKLTVSMLRTVTNVNTTDGKKHLFELILNIFNRPLIPYYKNAMRFRISLNSFNCQLINMYKVRIRFN